MIFSLEDLLCPEMALPFAQGRQIASSHLALANVYRLSGKIGTLLGHWLRLLYVKHHVQKS